MVGGNGSVSGSTWNTMGYAAQGATCVTGGTAMTGDGSTGAHASEDAVGRGSANGASVSDFHVATALNELRQMFDEQGLRGKTEPEKPVEDLTSNIEKRVNSIGMSVIETAKGSQPAVEEAIHLFRDWMVGSRIVRVIGAGRAKLAGSIPANRLAHGGARVFIIDDMTPMPHTIRGGGVLAVSASGKTESVLDVLRSLEQKNARVKVVGIARDGADEFRDLCDVFIGIQQVELRNPLQALADTEEYVISMLLDAMVVAAGRLAGFDQTKWGLGHEDIGPTGPYDPARLNSMGLAVTMVDTEGWE